MEKKIMSETPHRRYNSLTGEWVLVSPHRTRRPWQGKSEKTRKINTASYDPSCYLCPGNKRAGDEKNPDYKNTFVFTNDFSALLPDVPSVNNSDPLFRFESLRGTCRVICFSPMHDLTLAEMVTDDIIKVVKVWIDQYNGLIKDYRWVQIFENKGEIMGCSNPHPHGQIWASDILPNEAVKEKRQQREYYESNRSPLLCDYRDREMKTGERVVTENNHWLTVVPFWAVWPYETLLIPKDNISSMSQLSGGSIKSLAEILKRLLTIYDNLFEISFPYTMGWHNAPGGVYQNEYWTLHAHFYPPLLRSATVKKFMVGYEMLSEAQRDITPEQAADTLRNISDKHYKLKRS